MSDTFDITKLDVLVVEDEKFMRKLIVRVLQELGILSVFEAENGAVGLSQVKSLEGKLDLILCDLEMPVIDGLKFIQGLREGVAGQSQKKTPVIVLTGHSDADNVKKAVELGIQGYLVKPFSPAALEKRIRSAVGAPPP